jgi:hypothetical protein
MLSSNKILIPFHETDHFTSDIISPVVEYYNSFGYEVKTAGIIDDEHKVFLRSASRNLVVEENKDQEIIIIIDGDTFVSIQAIENAINICKEEDIVVRLATKTLSIKNNVEVVKDLLIEGEIIPQELVSLSHKKYLHPGCSWVMNRKTWEKLGGFNESFIWYGFEDLEFNLRASRVVGLVFLDFDEYNIPNKKAVNFDHDIHKNEYKNTYTVFYDPEEMCIEIDNSGERMQVDKNIIKDIFNFDLYGIF